MAHDHAHDHDHTHGYAADVLSHDHVFLGKNHDRNARKTWSVVAFCTVMMVVEIVAGLMFNSMALLADGVHMATHAGALLVAAIAYAFARRKANDPRFSFGTGKVGDLAAFGSAIVLATTSVLIAIESVERLVSPLPIAYNQAIPVAALGLVVNLISAWLLHDGHDHGHHAHSDDHDHDHEHDDDHGHHHHDFNLKSAYAHVAADALVSVMAIVGLVLGRQFGWSFLDPIMGFAGAFFIARWSILLMRGTGAVLVDFQPVGLTRQIRKRLETDGAKVTDLHVWRLGPGHTAALISLCAPHPEPTRAYKKRLAGLSTLSHVTIEVVELENDDHDHHH